MTDYTTLIDDETWAFIRRTDAFYPPDTVDQSIEQQRAVYDSLCREFHTPHPPGLETGTGWFEIREPHLPLRVYRPSPDAPAVVLYLHGGGFVLGGLDSHDDVCAEIAARTGFDVLAVDYRLAPEHKHPAAFDDAYDVFAWLAERDKPVLLCGDSAGGNLAAAVAHAARGRCRPALGQVLIYPGLGGERTGRSYVEHASAPMLTVRDLDFYKTVRGRGDPADPTQYPLGDRDFTGLPPTVIITAQCDPLSSDGEAYRDRILSAGGKAVWIEERGLVHGYLRGRHTVGRARDSFTRIVDALSALGKGAWPY